MPDRFLDLRALGLMLVSMCVAACAGAPVQEMSNARQAIRAARDAGAEKLAPQTLNEAETLLQNAERSLQNRAYKDARRSAVAARGKAAEALVATQPSERHEPG
jgi:sialic acid synthase SpsE